MEQNYFNILIKLSIVKHLIEMSRILFFSRKYYLDFAILNKLQSVKNKQVNVENSQLNDFELNICIIMVSLRE